MARNVQRIGMGNEQTTIFKYLYNRYFVKYLTYYQFQLRDVLKFYVLLRILFKILSDR